MNVLFVLAEMAPLAKVGGVGDVGGSLPQALARVDCEVRVALPYYRSVKAKQPPTERVADLPHGAVLWRSEAAGVPVYLIDHPPSFDRDEIYGHDDDADRFLAFCDGVLASAELLDWSPDLLHLHDWHSGFIAARLAGDDRHPWAGLPRVCTIHNLGFPGPFGERFVRAHGLPPGALAAPDGIAPELPYSALAQGIMHADLVSTVSPTYAREILTPEYGEGLDPLLRRLGDRLAGVLNGIDTRQFDPATDSHLAARFDVEHLDRRVENRRALQARLGLPQDDTKPLLGMVSRLFEQKGSDLAVEAVEALLARHDVQFAVLGQGEANYERQLAALAKRHPDRVAAQIAFDLALGQLIYGGSDLFLMPSRYEPCGLGQMIAMRYGAVPVVRRTGGLADSVEPHRHDQGTGFVFDDATPQALAVAIEGALTVYTDRDAWRRLQERGMRQDFSWEHAAGQYVELYRRAADVRAGAR